MADELIADIFGSSDEEEEFAVSDLFYNIFITFQWSGNVDTV